MQPELRYARTTEGVSIAWTTAGDGPALVMMPGVPFSDAAAEWRIPVLRQAFERLARRLRLIQYDGRGTGHSQRDVTDLSLEAMLRDLDAVVAAAGLKTYALLGFYASGPFAIAHAAAHPDRVTNLILFGASTSGWSPMSGSATQALLSLIERDWDTFVESATHAWLGWPDAGEARLAADWFRTATTPDNAKATLRAASGIDVTADAARVRCPTLVLHRRDTPVFPLAMSEALAESLPNAELRVVAGASASLFFEHTDAIVETLIGFVTGSPPEASPRTRATPTPNPDRPAGLSPRELEVLRLLARGETNAEIAHLLRISINTVERHVANLYRKIDARGRADAAAFAVRSGVV